MDYNRQGGGPSRRHPAASAAPTTGDAYYSMDYSTNLSGFDDGGGRRSATATPGPPPHQSGFGGYGGGGGGGNINTGFNAPMDQSFGGHQSGPYGGPPPQPAFNAFAPGPPQPPPQAGQPPPGFASGFGPQQQFLMAAGEQLFTNPMTKAAIDAYTGSLVDKSKTWIGGVKCYFAVDTSYVLKKLMLIFLPFLHKDWCIRYSSDAVTPREEPNLPDLYIPSMAFITYCLLSGYILGLQNRFAPEQLGIYASSALAWLLLEVFVIVVAKYVLNMSSLLGFFHLIAFGGYKFVSIVAILLMTLIFGQTGFQAAFIYTALTLIYFLLKSLNANLQTSSTSSYSSESPRTGQYLVIVVCLFQPVVIWFLTNSLKPSSAAAAAAASAAGGAAPTV